MLKKFQISNNQEKYCNDISNLSSVKTQNFSTYNNSKNNNSMLYKNDKSPDYYINNPTSNDSVLNSNLLANELSDSNHRKNFFNKNSLNDFEKVNIRSEIDSISKNNSKYLESDDTNNYQDLILNNINANKKISFINPRKISPQIKTDFIINNSDISYENKNNIYNKNNNPQIIKYSKIKNLNAPSDIRKSNNIRTNFITENVDENVLICTKTDKNNSFAKPSLSPILFPITNKNTTKKKIDYKHDLNNSIHTPTKLFQIPPLNFSNKIECKAGKREEKLIKSPLKNDIYNGIQNNFNSNVNESFIKINQAMKNDLSCNLNFRNSIKEKNFQNGLKNTNTPINISRNSPQFRKILNPKIRIVSRNMDEKVYMNTEISEEKNFNYQNIINNSNNDKIKDYNTSSEIIKFNERHIKDSNQSNMIINNVNEDVFIDKNDTNGKNIYRSSNIEKPCSKIMDMLIKNNENFKKNLDDEIIKNSTKTNYSNKEVNITLNNQVRENLIKQKETLVSKEKLDSNSKKEIDKNVQDYYEQSLNSNTNEPIIKPLINNKKEQDSSRHSKINNKNENEDTKNIQNDQNKINNDLDKKILENENLRNNIELEKTEKNFILDHINSNGSNFNVKQKNSNDVISITSKEAILDQNDSNLIYIKKSSKLSSQNDYVISDSNEIEEIEISGKLISRENSISTSKKHFVLLSQTSLKEKNEESNVLKINININKGSNFSLKNNLIRENSNNIDSGVSLNDNDDLKKINNKLNQKIKLESDKEDTSKKNQNKEILEAERLKIENLIKNLENVQHQNDINDNNCQNENILIEESRCINNKIKDNLNICNIHNIYDKLFDFLKSQNNILNNNKNNFGAFKEVIINKY